MKFKIKKLTFHFFDKSAGLFYLNYEIDEWRYVGCHFLIKNYKDWRWGYDEIWYDGPWPMFYLGPFFLFVWQL